jgi:predicted PurR-regulated permease PerM
MSEIDSHYNHQHNRIGRVFILSALAVSLYLGWKMLRPFFSAVAIAAILDVIFYPLYARLTRAFGGRRKIASGITVLVVVLVVILPLIGMGILFTKQALDLYTGLSAKAQDGSYDSILRFRDWAAVENWLATHAPWLDVQALNLKGIFLIFIQRLGGFGVAFGTSAASNMLGAVGTFAVVVFSLFFILLDGAGFARWVWAMVPLDGRHREIVSRTFIEIVKSSVLGSGVVAIAQGILGGLAFWIVGLPAVLWGSIMAFMSLVPVVGTAIIWAPAGLVLLLQDRVGAGAFILIWGFAVISSADNVVRLFAIKGPVQMHPLLLFFSIMGGIKLSGLLGVIYGPLVLAMIQTLFGFFREEFLETPAPEDRPSC